MGSKWPTKELCFERRVMTKNLPDQEMKEKERKQIKGRRIDRETRGLGGKSRENVVR